MAGAADPLLASVASIGDGTVSYGDSGGPPHLEGAETTYGVLSGRTDLSITGYDVTFGAQFDYVRLSA